MEWKQLSLGETHFRIPCTVCRRQLPDPTFTWGNSAYFLVRLTDTQEEWIRHVWGVDPYESFVVCEECMAGHGGTLQGLTADAWLARQVQRWLERQSGKVSEKSRAPA
jgi:hypothetical protein